MTEHFSMPVPVTIYNMNETKKPFHENDYRVEPRPFGCIAYVESGQGDYQTENHGFKLNKGDILFIPVGGTYQSYWKPAPHMLAIHFEMPMTRGYRHTVQRLCSIEGDREDFLAAMRQKEIDFTLLERFYRICKRHWHELERIETSFDVRIRPALERIELKLDQSVKVDELAALCHMSQSHFYSVFRASVGVSPIEYRNRRLMMQAARMLTLTEKSIGEIAFELGFESENYFRQIFRAQLGCSPREYRNRDGASM